MPSPASGSSRSAGEEYAIALASASQHRWTDLHRRYEEGVLSDVGALVLIHPLWYGGVGRSGACEVRGDPGFRQRPANQVCQASEFWGYVCPFESVALHCDHRFPYRLGGPTIPDNAAWLCEEHNRAKGGDWHVCVGKAHDYSWFAEVLERVRRLVP